jgi:hypothetical protein
MRALAKCRVEYRHPLAGQTQIVLFEEAFKALAALFEAHGRNLRTRYE